jgi:hypothetical protein
VGALRVLRGLGVHRLSDNPGHVLAFLKESVMGNLVDLNPTREVEIQIRSDSKVVWVNVDGVCRLRLNIADPAILQLNDERK